MIGIDGPAYRLCDGVTRRRRLEVGACSALGLSLQGLLAPRAAAGSSSPGPDTQHRTSHLQRPTPKNCIMLWLWGAPSHLDTWDMKPDQPAEVRGYWKPIP